MLILAVWCGLAVGLWRGSLFDQTLRIYSELYGQSVLLEATARTDGTYDKKLVTFDVSDMKVLQPVAANLPGKIKVQTTGGSIYRGDRVRLQGRIYPTRGSKQASMRYAAATVLHRSDSLVEKFRLKFLGAMQSALPEPHASFALGLLIGQRATLPDDFAEALSAVGLTHIIAVSGYNLTILVRFVRRFDGVLSKYQLTICSLLLISSFVLITGFSASIVRAALVSVLSLIAWYYGRTFRPVLLLTLVAAVTGLWYPLYVWSDIGWYLSFLAFYGVLVLAPLAVQRVFGTKEPNAYTMLAIESVAAQLMTIPLIMYIFGEISLVALLSNILVVPLVPIAMLCALAAGLAGMAVPGFAGWLALPAQVLLTYFIDTVLLLSKVPGVLLKGSLQVGTMVAMYGIILFVSIIMWRKTEVKYGILGKSEEEP